MALSKPTKLCTVTLSNGSGFVAITKDMTENEPL